MKKSFYGNTGFSVGTLEALIEELGMRLSLRNTAGQAQGQRKGNAVSTGKGSGSALWR